MRGGKFNLCKARDSMPQYQRGVVLLIALIVLVAMTLAGIGMMRSIDTTTLIAGNVAFKQTTIQAGDRGISEGFNNVLLRASSDPLDKPVLSWTTGSACPAGVSAALCPGGNINLPGYAAAPLQACEVDNTCPPGQPWWMQTANWNSAPSVAVTDPNGGTVATVSYLIHRMCTTAGLASNDPGNICQTYQESGAANPCHGVGCVQFPNVSVFYRITSRSVGPRGTVAYSQSLVLVPE